MSAPKSLYTIDPVTGKLRLNLHYGQTRVWTSSRRFVFMLAGTQSGKTSFGPWWLWREIKRRGPGDYLAVSSTFDLFNLKMLPELQVVFERVLKIGRLHSGAGVIELKNPETGEFEARRATDPMWGRIIMRSATAESGLESATAKAAWMDEVGQDQFSLEAWEAIQRRLSLNLGRALGTTTLYNVGWLRQQVYDRWKAGDPDYDVIQYASTLNPSFPQEEYERAKRTLPLWKFNMFYRGLFTRPPGQIYSDVDEEIHMFKPRTFPVHWPRYVGVDPGGVNLATIWIVENPGTRVYYIYRETHEGDMTTEEHVKRAQERAEGTTVAIWVGGAPSEEQIRRDWNNYGIPLLAPRVTDVESGIDRVISLFKQGRLFFAEDLAGLRDELATYSRELGKNDEVTKVIKNKNQYHRLDALRYVATFLDETFSLGDLGEPETMDDPWEFMHR